MIDLIRAYLGASASTQIVEITASVLLVAFVCIVCSMTCGILNRFFR